MSHLIYLKRVKNHIKNNNNVYVVKWCDVKPLGTEQKESSNIRGTSVSNVE